MRRTAPSGYDRAVALTFVIARSVEHRETPAALEHFSSQLSHQLGEPVTARLVDSYGILRRALAEGGAELGWLPPLVFADAGMFADRREVLPLVASVRGGAAEYCSVLFAGDRAPPRGLADLRGSTVAWVDRRSASGYLLARAHLFEQGVDPQTLFARELYLGSHGAVVRAVLDGVADVGATFGGPPGAEDPDRRSGFAQVEGAERARVLFRTDPIPADVVVCRPSLPPTLRERLTAALLGLSTFAVGRRVTRRLFGADGFAPVGRAALDRLRTLVGTARERGWLNGSY